MNVADFDFVLPDELIAQQPAARRDESRLLVLGRASGVTVHTTFPHVADYLRAGDLLVLNDTRVFPARLLGRRTPSGGAVECLLLRQIDPPLGIGASAAANAVVWETLMHPGQKLKPGAHVTFEGAEVRLHGEVLARHFHGRRTIRLWSEDGLDVATVIDGIGHVPLPPYIKRPAVFPDRERYQTVYAKERGSIAAPTAGLHFTADLLRELTSRGIERTDVTLHVGYGTFKPVRAERVEDHRVDAEVFTVSPAAADALTRARRDRRRIVAVGTTTARALESLTVDVDGRVGASSGETRLFIHPGHRFVLVDALITNFHLPRSSLLMLVAAFGERGWVLAAYREAVDRRYRFYSYGDAMLII